MVCTSADRNVNKQFKQQATREVSIATKGKRARRDFNGIEHGEVKVVSLTAYNLWAVCHMPYDHGLATPPAKDLRRARGLLRSLSRTII
jgi:hypothetical protein